jgi:hypothetical protein
VKKSEFIQDVASEIVLANVDSEHVGPVINFGAACLASVYVLDYLIEAGFRLPLKQNILILDEQNQPVKHGPSEYGFDPE